MLSLQKEEDNVHVYRESIELSQLRVSVLWEGPMQMQKKKKYSR